MHINILFKEGFSVKIFLAIKYYDDMQNKELIENICKALESQGHSVFAFARNIQNYGPCNMSGNEVMSIAFNQIKSSDAFVIDASELSIGIGVEAGVAYSNNIPIYTIARKGCYVSNSILGISKNNCFYETCDDLKQFEF